MSFSDSRQQYWNSKYTEYWQQRVAESSNERSEIVSGDSVTPSEISWYHHLSKVPFKSGNILDIGCGWGRFFNYFEQNNLRISGIDISSSMIEKANEKFLSQEFIESLDVGIAEDLPYESNTFDNVCCLATFDATYQNKSLSEFLRVLKPGGNLYLSGKNYMYHDNDNEALVAENNARLKGHPNFFTNLTSLIQLCEILQINTIYSAFFDLRGDFSRVKYSLSKPMLFYEYFIVMTPTSEMSTSLHLPSISCDYSDTFVRKHLI